MSFNEGLIQIKQVTRQPNRRNTNEYKDPPLISCYLTGTAVMIQRLTGAEVASRKRRERVENGWHIVKKKTGTLPNKSLYNHQMTAAVPVLDNNNNNTRVACVQQLSDHLIQSAAVLQRRGAMLRSAAGCTVCLRTLHSKVKFTAVTPT